jgi:hypothetical protein
LILAILTLLNFFSWLLILLKGYRLKSIRNYLNFSSIDKNKNMIPSFVDNYCGLDGSFVFTIIRRNTNYMTTSEIISNLYVKYCLDLSNLKKIEQEEEEENNQNESDENTKSVVELFE